MEYPKWPITEARYLGGPTDKIRLPRYQRGLEWDSAHQVKLIDSILKEYPIGALLVSKKIEGEADVFTVLDGHQRLGTIKKYLERPLDKLWDPLWGEIVAKDGDVEVGAIKQLVLDAIEGAAEFSEKEKTHLCEHLDSWLHSSFKSVHETAIESGFGKPTAARLYSELMILVEKECVIKLTPAQQHRLEKVHERIHSAVTLRDEKIPVIIYAGVESEFSNLFFRLNAQGKALSPYQEQAAKWSEVFVEHKGLVPVFDETKKVVEANTGNAVSDMTLAEYFWGFSNVLSTKMPGIVKRDTPELSWHIVGDLTGHQISERTYLLEKHLVDNYSKGEGGVLKLDVLTGIVEEAAKVVNSSLEFLKAGRQNPVAVRDLRIMSALIAAVAVKLFDLKLGVPAQTKPTKKSIAGLEHKIRARYIFDWFDDKVAQLSRNSQLFDCVWDRSKKAASDWLDGPLDHKTFIENVTRWSKDHLTKRSPESRESVSNEGKLLYQCLYDFSSSTFKTVSNNYDHLIPRKHLKAKPKKDSDYIVNIDHPGNLGPIDASLNADKGPKTITEYYEITGDEKVKAYKKAFPIKKIQEVQLFVSKDLKDLVRKFKKPSYDAFVHERLIRIARKISEEMLSISITITQFVNHGDRCLGSLLMSRSRRLDPRPQRRHPSPQQAGPPRHPEGDDHRQRLESRPNRHPGTGAAVARFMRRCWLSWVGSHRSAVPVVPSGPRN